MGVRSEFGNTSKGVREGFRPPTSDLQLPPHPELHCKTNFSFLNGASHADELVRRAMELGYSSLAITDQRKLTLPCQLLLALPNSSSEPRLSSTMLCRLCCGRPIERRMRICRD